MHQSSGGDQAQGTRRSLRSTLLARPAIRQYTDGDPLGRGAAAVSARTSARTARTATADRVVQSICPYCAVGCGQKVFVKDEKVITDRGRPRLTGVPGSAVPEGVGQRAAGQQPRPADRDAVPPAVRYRVGAA